MLRVRAMQKVHPKLSTRVAYACVKAGFSTLEAFAANDDEWLRRRGNFGPKSLAELRSITGTFGGLSGTGLSLAGFSTAELLAELMRRHGT